MKKIWDDRRTFLSFLAIVGLLALMYKTPEKDFAFEIVALAGGIGFINAWEKKKNEPKK